MIKSYCDENFKTCPYLFTLFCRILSSALPTHSPTRQCMKYEHKRVDGKQQQIGSLNDNSISSNESQEDSESDDNDIDSYFDANSTEITSTTNVSCTNSQPFCFSAYKILNDGSVRVESQGCWEHSDGCNSASCIGSDERNSIIFSCCNTDYCNTHFVHTTPKTSPVIVHPNDDESRNGAGKIRLRNSAVWISFASTFFMLIVIGIVFFISCRGEKSSKPLQETSPLAPSGPGYSSNLYNVDNLKPISIIGEGKYGTVWKGQINEQV